MVGKGREALEKNIKKVGEGNSKRGKGREGSYFKINEKKWGQGITHSSTT